MSDRVKLAREFAARIGDPTYAVVIWSPKMEEQEKNVSASPQRTGIGPETAPNQLWTTGCARNATRKIVQGKRILMGQDRVESESLATASD